MDEIGTCDNFSLLSAMQMLFDLLRFRIRFQRRIDIFSEPRGLTAFGMWKGTGVEEHLNYSMYFNSHVRAHLIGC